MKRSGNVVVFSERQDVGIELLSAARLLAGESTVVTLIRSDNAHLVREQVEHGADVAIVLGPFNDADPVELALEALNQTLLPYDPDVVLIGATAHGTEVASRFAQRHGLGCASECTALDRLDGRLVIERTCLGRFVERKVIVSRPAVATVQPRRFEPTLRDEARTGEIERLVVEDLPDRMPVLETRRRGKSNVRIDKADVVVGVGRGLCSRKDLNMIEELANTLGGVLGASRPLTDDLHWVNPDRKIGLSGITVAPRLYIACGISGQIEHHVGMRESGVVVAINKDPDAPIMRQADYCIQGDLHEIVPALTKAIRNAERTGA